MPVDIIRVLTWNAGGLTKQVFQELETYARESGVDIFYIQDAIVGLQLVQHALSTTTCTQRGPRNQTRRVAS